MNSQTNNVRQFSESLPEKGKRFVLHTKDIRDNCIRYLQRLACEDVIQVDIKRYKSKRSLEQNARYWAMLKEISEQVGIDGKRFTDEVWHEYFKTKFLVKDAVMINGQVVIQHESTTKLNIADFTNYMMEVEAHAAQELGVVWGR